MSEIQLHHSVLGSDLTKQPSLQNDLHSHLNQKEKIFEHYYSITPLTLQSIVTYIVSLCPFPASVSCY